MAAPKSACTFQLPVAYNDGRPIEPEVMLEILRALDRQFEGYTIRGPFRGSWQGQEEESYTVEVAVSPSEVPTLRAVVIAIGQRLGQKAMYFRVPPPDVEIIDIPAAPPDPSTEPKEEKPKEENTDV